MKIDMWYGDEFERGKYGADAYFTPGAGNGYRGNIYDDNGKNDRRLSHRRQHQD